MKCLILAGGRGDRMWPLSRGNYPKQFIKIQKNHSAFQETIADNISLCDEFVVVTNKEYQFIVEQQLQTFQGIAYRNIYEEIGRNMTAAAALACLSVAPSEIIYLVPATQLVRGESYREEVLEAKFLARKGKIAVLDAQGQRMLFQAGDFLYEMEQYMPEFLEACVSIYEKREHKGRDITFARKELNELPSLDITESILNKTDRAQRVNCRFQVLSIDVLEDLDNVDFLSDGLVQEYKSGDNLIINKCQNQMVLANDLNHTVVINTPDAIYVGKKGSAKYLKEIQHSCGEIRKYFDKGNIAYRHWGTYEIIADQSSYLVKRVKINSGETIYAHKHLFRRERWIIVQGKARITINGKAGEYISGDCISVDAGQIHQISNAGNTELLIIEVATGENVHEEDMVSVESRDVTDAELGLVRNTLVKLIPAFKDYIWGGTRIRDYLGKMCDYVCIAESWEVSAHEDGPSIVGSGKYKGMRFNDYLKVIGHEKLGWKCSSVREFPLLVKFIDSQEDLSIQVHPDDEYAWDKERKTGKNEMWYVMEAEEGAGIYLGFRNRMTQEGVREHVQKGTLLEALQWYPAHKGDVFFIPAGTVHAVGKGLLLCEIQQSSNVTYRLYDYDRRDRYGKKRELHLESALDVLNYEPYSGVCEQMPGSDIPVWFCKYFVCTKWEISGKRQLPIDESSFLIVICIEGMGEIQICEEKLEIKRGECVFVPAGEVTLNLYGELTILSVRM